MLMSPHTQRNDSSPYWRLSGFYFFYFAVVGTLMPFWSLYLEYLNFSAKEISWLMAVFGASRIFAPLLWGWWTDKRLRIVENIRLKAVRQGAFWTIPAFIGIYGDTHLIWVGVVMCLFGFFWSAILPLYEAITLEYIQESTSLYGRIRLWGSCGFIIAVVSLGVILDSYDLSILPHILLLLFVGILMTAMLTPLSKPSTPSVSVSLPNSAPAHVSSLAQQNLTQSPSNSFWLRMTYRPVWIFFLISFLLQLSFGAYYTYYSLYLSSFGYLKGEIGFLWSLGVMAEIFIFLIMPSLISRFGVYYLMLMSLLLTSGRWFLTAFFPELWVVQGMIQLVHAFSFGATHAIAIRFIQEAFKEGLEGQGQSFYMSLCYGVASVCGALLSGYLWDSWSAEVTFAVCGGIALFSGGLFWAYFHHTTQQSESIDHFFAR